MFPLLVFAVLLAGCNAAHDQHNVPAGTSEPDKFLFDKGTEALNRKKWATAREYFKKVVETYTQSQYRPDAKLGLGDTYLGENSSESLVLAANEYKEFLSFYPTNRRADYAQYKLALTHFAQMRAPQRDQTETRNTIKELETFVERYPRSALMPQAREKLRIAKDRLDGADYAVGLFYFRTRWYPGAIDRFKAVLKSDPQFSGRDAVYFYLGESFLKTNKQAEALPYYEQLLKEYERSEFLEPAKRRIAELKTDTTAAAKPPAQ